MNTSFLVSSMKENDVEIKTTVLEKDLELKFDMSIKQCDNNNKTFAVRVPLFANSVT